MLKVAVKIEHLQIVLIILGVRETIVITSNYQKVELTPYLKETPFNIFANGADPDQAAMFAYGNMIRCDHTLVALTSKLNICSMYKCESLIIEVFIVDIVGGAEHEYS